MSSTTSKSEGLTLAILGCGTIGTAILTGLLSALDDPNNTSPRPSRTPTRFHACVTSVESRIRLIKAVEVFSANRCACIAMNDNVFIVQGSDIILLTCPPSSLNSILSEPGMREALSGKILISCLPGVSVSQITDILYPRLTYADQLSGAKQLEPDCAIVRAIPNIASSVRSSTTIISVSPTSTSTPSAAQWELVDWLFSLLGPVHHLPHQPKLDAATALTASGPAFFALVLESAVQGAVAMGLGREEAARLAAESMRGAAELVLADAGTGPAEVREKAGTPGGATLGGLLVLEEGGVRGAVSRAVRETASLNREIGKGVQGVNGTRGGGGVI